MQYMQKLKAENEALRRKLRELGEDKIVREFALQVGDALMVCLANTPLCDWPPVARAALNHCTKKAQTAAKLYKARLPLD